MGFSISWLAAKGASAKKVREQLSLQPTGEVHQHPYKMFSGASMGEWYLIHIERCEHEFVRKATLEELSMESEVLAVNVEEHVMFSSSEYWRNGRKIWSVSHAGEFGNKAKAWLLENGDLPEIYAGIKARLMQEQEEAEPEPEVDYIFEVPLDLAAALTGFKHDQLTEAEFEVLRLLKRKSWLRWIWP